MGAWGAGSLENDTAEAWLAELKQAEADGGAPGLLGDAIEPLADPALGLIDADEASRAVAAAEIVAALLGRPGAALPQPVLAWLGRHEAAFGGAARALQPTALATLSRVKTASELRAFWDANDNLAAFEAAIDELHERLRAAG